MVNGLFIPIKEFAWIMLLLVFCIGCAICLYKILKFIANIYSNDCGKSRDLIDWIIIFLIIQLGIDLGIIAILYHLGVLI